MAYGHTWLNVISPWAYLNDVMGRTRPIVCMSCWVDTLFLGVGRRAGIGLGHAFCFPMNLQAGISWYSLMMPWLEYCRVVVRCTSTTKNHVGCVVCQALLKLTWNYLWAFVLYFTVLVPWMILLIFSRILFGLLSLMCYHVAMCYIMVLEKNLENVLLYILLWIWNRKRKFLKLLLLKTCMVFTGLFSSLLILFLWAASDN